MFWLQLHLTVTTFYRNHICSRNLTFTDDKAHKYEIKDVLEMEMRLLEGLDYYLVIYHPYRPLIQ